MFHDSVKNFTDEVLKYLIAQNELRRLLVRKHSEKLQVHGDFSFPNTLKSWHISLDGTDNGDENFMKFINKQPNDLTLQSQTWSLPLKKVADEKCRIHLFLERPKAIHIAFLECTENVATILRRIESVPDELEIDPLCVNKTDLTYLRLTFLRKVMSNLKCIKSCNEESPVFLTTKSSSKCPKGSTLVFCGTVLNAKNGLKEVVISADEFIKMRQDEMTLIAQHKYGVRVSTDSKWKEFNSHLGISAVKFELLQSKPSSAVKINFEHSAAGSSKGAAFILYNCARLESIIRTYNERVQDGSYPKLPDYEDLDFTLLTQEDEWNLVFNFVMGLPSLLERCMEMGSTSCEFRPHYICSFLCSMVRVISQYYRKVRILTEPRKHLLPVMFARIYMLLCLNKILKTCLTILDIKSISQM